MARYEEFLKLLVGQWLASESGGVSRPTWLEQSVSRELPYDYLAFLRLSNGGEGANNLGYISLWSAETVPQLNDVYQIGQHLPFLLAFGTDGGGIAYAFDFCQGPSPTVVMVPLGDLSDGAVVSLAFSFRAFLIAERAR